MLTLALPSSLITPQDNLLNILEESLRDNPLKNKDVLVISSKVLAITQGRLKKISSPEDFEALVRSEADVYYGGKIAALTQKDGIFIPWAGIDRSNIPEGYAVLWPEKSFEAANMIREQLMEKYGLQELGVLISDSACMPFRQGVIAVTLGYAGFEGVHDLRGKPDLYGKPLKVSQQALADMVAISAHLVMGESDERTPFAIVRDAPITFTDTLPDPAALVMEAEDCLFSPLWGKEY